MIETMKMAFRGATFIDYIATLYDTHFGGVVECVFGLILALCDDILQPHRHAHTD